MDDEQVYISNLKGHCLSVYSKAGTFVRKWGSLGSGDGQFQFPRGVAVDGGNVYVADRSNDRVQVFTNEGTHVRNLGNGLGAGEGQLNWPVGVAVDNEHVFVGDVQNNRMQVFRKDGQHVREVRHEALDGMQALKPFHLAVRGGQVYCTCFNNVGVFLFGS
jgi:DNA-binding beta-propeller fold protein YncE